MTAGQMAERHGISKDAVARIWRDYNLRPCKVSTFKISNDPHFEEKRRRRRRALNAPARTCRRLLLRREGSARDRTQPSLPLTPVVPTPFTHDDKRKGTTNPSAAMNVAIDEFSMTRANGTPRTTCAGLQAD
jgi:hypothetical protein